MITHPATHPPTHPHAVLPYSAPAIVVLSTNSGGEVPRRASRPYREKLFAALADVELLYAMNDSKRCFIIIHNMRAAHCYVHVKMKETARLLIQEGAMPRNFLMQTKYLPASPEKISSFQHPTAVAVDPGCPHTNGANL